jgi:hypothetical protein
VVAVDLMVMNAVDSVVWWLFIVLLFAAGAYGVWHSITAKEFTARETLSGRAKYRYRPNQFQRVLHFIVSALFSLAALIFIFRRIVS